MKREGRVKRDGGGRGVKKGKKGGNEGEERQEEE
jgi:hypothetical protein